MMTFEELSGSLRGCYGLLCFFIVLGAVYLLVISIRQKEYKMLWGIIPVLVIMYISEQNIALYQHRISLALRSKLAGKMVYTYVKLPVALIALITVIAITYEIWCHLTLRKNRQTMITSFSVKEVMDGLPTGILVYRREGRIFFINHIMENICRKLYGKYPVNGNEFKNNLNNKAFNKKCKRMDIGDKIILSFDDENTYQIAFESLEYQDRDCEMVIATDITEEFLKMNELKESTNNLKNVNEQLVEKNKNIVDLITEKEILNAKVRIHNELGALSLQIRKYISEGEHSKEREMELREELKKSISFIKTNNDEEIEDECNQIITVAEKFGVQVEITGEIPANKKTRHLVACGIHECLTNTLRHAHGNILFVDIKDVKDEIELTFRSNGEQPKEEIIERGGLKSLRNLIENAGGSMKVVSMPELIIHIKFKEDGIHV